MNLETIDEIISDLISLRETLYRHWHAVPTKACRDMEKFIRKTIKTLEGERTKYIKENIKGDKT